MLCSIAGAAMILAITVTLWMLTVTFLDRLVPRRFEMVLWSLSLLGSLALSAFLVARSKRFRPRVIHAGLAAIAAIASYAWLEGRASGAGEPHHAVLFYGTAVFVPIVLVGMIALTPNANQNSH